MLPFNYINKIIPLSVPCVEFSDFGLFLGFVYLNVLLILFAFHEETDGAIGIKPFSYFYTN